MYEYSGAHLLMCTCVLDFRALCADFTIPHDLREGYVNNSRERFEFHFNRVFDADTLQDEVFDGVARAAVLNALDGYNSTIFAYGQTGSGKTYTMTGGTERYEDRGIIPRAISMIYQELNKVVLSVA